ncbi:hypothetical protein OAL13_00220 [bacterium]|nr:hypothetical protein [bacterium]
MTTSTAPLAHLFADMTESEINAFFEWQFKRSEQNQATAQQINGFTTKKQVRQWADDYCANTDWNHLETVETFYEVGMITDDAMKLAEKALRKR